MAKIIQNLIFAALVFSSFTIWFALTEYIRINFLFIGLAFILCLYDSKLKFPLTKNISFQQFNIFIVLIFILISFIINNQIRPQPKVLSNFIGTYVIIGVLYICYGILVEKYMTIEKCIKGLAYGGVLLMFVIFTDAILVNFANIEIQNIFVFGKEASYSYFNRGIWISTSSPTAEPAHAITFLNILFPFVILHFRDRNRTIYTLLYIFCIFSSFSVTAIASLLVIPLLLLFTNIPSIYKFRIVFIYLICTLILLLFIWNNEEFQTLLSATNFIDKVSMSGNTISDRHRTEGFSLAIKHGIESPIYGMGPGYGKYIFERGYLSFFLTILGDYGFIAFFAFILFWSSFYFKCFRINKKIRIYFFISFLFCTIASCINDNMHNFIIWAILPIINKAYNINIISKKSRKYDTKNHPLLLVKQ